MKYGTRVKVVKKNLSSTGKIGTTFKTKGWTNRVGVRFDDGSVTTFSMVDNPLEVVKTKRKEKAHIRAEIKRYKRKIAKLQKELDAM